MADGYVEHKGMVSNFLDDLKIILNNQKSKLKIYPREDKELEYTTKYCLQELNFTSNDVKNELKKLTVDSYVETCDDERNKKSNRYYVFYKKIKGKDIYIKVKIESRDNKSVLCMSFHFPEYEITKFPYR